ncbi:1-aminocyclopropane-1-carboxylate deaminase/D-cysteine desulfhydrase [Riemerella columbina]|uniref:1-aminocyclopropane-1-carboxylate deaminase/D-cysteine desulfhydrase n=1 Tax=Riemerella columbina TaxID=103810 RepID=UPI00035D0EE2|nr:pyridoxal-phosphate dependent enzyme [Riemerella columbina]
MGIFEVLDFRNLPERPIVPIPIAHSSVELYIKREDRVHPEISGNKFWKLFYNIHDYIKETPLSPRLITFGGAYSNHIAATAAVGKLMKIPTLGIIRGEELAGKWQDNPTLKKASEEGMGFEFVTRTQYRDKESLSQHFKSQYPDALLIPEGGSNPKAVEGIKLMLNDETKTFDYLCTAVGTGGTVAGLAKFSESHQTVLGFKVVNDNSAEDTVKNLNDGKSVQWIEAYGRGYGKITNELVAFINDFYERYHIPLEPIYTGKMMMQLIQMIEQNYFPEGSRILAFHTGGLQGIKGINEQLKAQNKYLIKSE